MKNLTDEEKKLLKDESLRTQKETLSARKHIRERRMPDGP